MTDILIRPAFSDSRLVLEDAYHRAKPNDRVVYDDGVFNIEGLTSYEAAVLVPSFVTSIAKNRNKATIRRGDHAVSHSVLAPSNFIKPNGENEGQLWDGLNFDSNYEGQPNWSEHYHFFDVLGLHNSKFQWIRATNLIGDAWCVSQNLHKDFPRTSRPSNIRWADCYLNGKRRNRNGISFVSCTKSAIEGSCVFEELTRDSMPAAVDYEPDSEEDLVEYCDTSGTFINCKSDVWVMAIAPKTTVRFCTANIVTNNPVPWDGLQVRCENNSTVYFSVASNRWDTGKAA